MVDEKTQQQLQEKYYELQMIDQQLKQVQKQIQSIDTQTNEAVGIQASLDDWKSVKKGSEVLVPLFNGIFFKAEIKDPTKFLVNSGSDTVVTKDHDSTRKIIDNQIVELNKYRAQFMMELQRLSMQAKMIEEELTKLAKAE